MTASTDTPWRRLVAHWWQGNGWDAKAYGPAPDQPDTRVPQDVLADFEIPRARNPQQERVFSDDDALAAQELAPAKTAPPPDPRADQRVAVRGSVRGLANIQDVDFGSVADAMPIDELLEARDDCEKAARTIEKWRGAIDEAIESAAGARDK